jgi:hypothetical protein
MAIFEMLKGGDPIYSAKRSLAIISEFPNQVYCTAGTGDLMRHELKERRLITTPIDEDLTGRMRHLLPGVAAFLAGRSSQFPLDETHVVQERAAALQQRLDHAFHKKMLDGGIAVLREKLSPELQKEIRSGTLSKDVYNFAFQTSFIAFRDAIADYKLPEEEVEQLFRKYCLTARQTIVYTLASMRWFEVGGPEAMSAEKVTNDLHDIDYVVLASYFDGIFSKEARVNTLYTRMKDFFAANIR